jgi:hypothetical protein
MWCTLNIYKIFKTKFVIFDLVLTELRIFRKTVAPIFENGYKGFANGVLLGDSAFPSSDFLVKMVDNVQNEDLKKFYLYLFWINCQLI